MLKRTLCRATLLDDLSNNNRPQADNWAQIRRTSVKLYTFLSKLKIELKIFQSIQWFFYQVDHK